LVNRSEGRVDECAYMDKRSKPRRRFPGVRRQQGRVEIDHDWNEAKLSQDPSGTSSDSARNRLTIMLVLVSAVIAFVLLRCLRGDNVGGSGQSA